MKCIIFLSDNDLKDIKLIRTYFGENSKTCHEHLLYIVIDTLIKKLQDEDPFYCKLTDSEGITDCPVIGNIECEDCNYLTKEKK